MAEAQNALVVQQSQTQPQRQISLHDYQVTAMNFLKQTPKCGLFLKMGLGKTLITLLSLEDLYRLECGHMLIVAPKTIAKTTWLLEMAKWNINLPYKSLICNENGKDFTKKKRLEAYQEVFSNPYRTLYFINRELVVDLVENLPMVNNQYIWPFQTVIIDEFQSFKSASSKRFKAMKKVSPAISRFVGLTGTPAPQGIEDLWSEIYLMDYGARLGTTLTAFRNAYMEPNFRTPLGQVVSWKARNGVEPYVYQRISDVVISMKNTAIQLPPLTEIYDYVYLDDKERKLYTKFAKEAVLNFEDGSSATAPNPAVITQKLQQIASGTIYTVDEDDENNGNYKIIHKRKLEMLKYIRDNVDDNIIVAYYFNSELDEITKFLTEHNIDFTVHSSKNAVEVQQKWDAGQIPLLLVHPASAGHGLNLQYSGFRLIWYTLSFNLEHYEQMICRVHRQGQVNPVFIHYLLTDRTVDQKVLASLRKKDDSQKAMFDALDYVKTLLANPD